MRTHSKKQVTQIAESISAFGFTNPVLADPEGNIISGHGRLRAAKELNLDEVPVIELSGLSETEKKALRLAAADTEGCSCGKKNGHPQSAQDDRETGKGAGEENPGAAPKGRDEAPPPC